MLQGARQKDRDGREAVRSNVFLTAMVDASGFTAPVRVRNISVHGALIEGGQLPTNGAVARLSCGGLTARGEIAWVSGDYRGLRFISPVDVQAWVKRVGHDGQSGVDRKLALLRGSNPPHPAEPLFDDGAGEDTFRAISLDLDQLCEELAASARMSVELGEELIRFDTIAQRLRRIAVPTEPY
jgi:hypothetical protein